MPQAQVTTLVADITVTEITPPQFSKAGKLMPARVKDSKGRVWNVWKDKFEQLDIEVGSSYAAMYTTRESIDQRTGQPREDHSIVSLNPLGAKTPAAAGSKPAPAYEDRSEDIAVQGISHCPEIAAAAAEGDVARGVKILRALRLIWREYKKQSVIAPTGGAEFDDEIPY